MAEIVDELPDSHKHTKKYQWHEWFDGRVWKLTRNVDFQGKCTAFRSCVTTAASQRNLSVKTRVRGDDVYIQACKPAPNGSAE